MARKPIGNTARHKHKKAKVSGKGKRRSQFNGGSHFDIDFDVGHVPLAIGNAGGNDEGRTDEVSCLPALPIADDDEIFLDAESGLDGAPRSRKGTPQFREMKTRHSCEDGKTCFREMEKRW